MSHYLETYEMRGVMVDNEPNMDVRVKRVVMDIVTRPGMWLELMNMENQANKTNNTEGKYVLMRWYDNLRFRCTSIFRLGYAPV